MSNPPSAPKDNIGLPDKKTKKIDCRRSIFSCLCNNEKVVNLVKCFEMLDFADKLRLSIDILKSYHIKASNK